jgi:hypothetical protein
VLLRLTSLCAPISLLQYRAKASSTPAEAGVDLSFGAYSRTSRGYAAPGNNPYSAGAIIDLVRTIAEHAVAVSDIADDAYLLVSITARIGIDLRDICLFRASSEEECAN